MDDEHFWIAPHAWKEIHAGADYNQAAKTLAGLGWLILGEDRHITRKKRGLAMRCYCLKRSILNARAGMTADEVERDEPVTEADKANSDIATGLEASMRTIN